MTTLLEKAKKVEVQKRGGKGISDEHIELAFAWLNDEVGAKQINAALGAKSSSANYLYAMAGALKLAYKQGKLIIK